MVAGFSEGGKLDDKDGDCRHQKDMHHTAFMKESAQYKPGHKKSCRYEPEFHVFTFQCLETTAPVAPVPDKLSLKAGRYRSGSALSRRFVELVSDATNCQHVLRIFRISLELFAKTIYVRIDVALVTFVLSAPDAIKQVVPRPGATRF